MDIDEILEKLATEPLYTTDDIYDAIAQAKTALLKVFEEKSEKKCSGLGYYYDQMNDCFRNQMGDVYQRKT